MLWWTKEASGFYTKLHRYRSNSPLLLCVPVMGDSPRFGGGSHSAGKTHRNRTNRQQAVYCTNRSQGETRIRTKRQIRRKQKIAALWCASRKTNKTARAKENTKKHKAPPLPPEREEKNQPQQNTKRPKTELMKKETCPWACFSFHLVTVKSKDKFISEESFFVLFHMY